MKPRKIERLHKRKKVLDFIIEKPRKYNELVMAAKQFSLSESTLKRILTELASLGVIKKEDGCWTQSAKYPKEYTSKEYEIAVEHAKQLLPGFEALLERPLGKYRVTGEKYVSPGRREKLKEFAESHLKTAVAYQPIYKNLIEYRNLKSKLKKLHSEKIDKILRGLTGKILTPDRFQIWDTSKKKSWFRKLFPNETEFVKKDIPYALGPFKTDEEIFKLFGISVFKPKSIVQTKETKEWFVLGPVDFVGSPETLKRLDGFIQTSELMTRVYGELAGQIHMLELRVEHGCTLDGHCEICPNIKINK